jgi:predicted acetyltransferase/N-acetylglutamate synthase-like GNAT family acetyltransferase
MNNATNFEPQLIPATSADLPLIQHLWLFYVYDMERFCGFNKGWESPVNPSFIPDDLTPYCVDPTKKAFLIYINTEVAGFILLNQSGLLPVTEWRIDEFFILAKFQGKGIGRQIAHQIWRTFPGHWELSVIPENKSALTFWRHAVSSFTNGSYLEEIHTTDLYNQPKKRYLLSFNSAVQKASPDNMEYSISHVDKISEDMEQQMTRGFIDYESSHGIDVNYKRFSLILENSNKQLLGVLNAFTAFAEIYIDDLWVDKTYRGMGYGTLLVQSLENQFKGQGFNNINLVTSAFQAPDFYKKCGFTPEFTRINTKNPQLTKTFFVKFFNEEIQTQGMLKK